MNNKLPVVSIFLEAIKLPFTHFKSLLIVAIPLIIIGFIIRLHNYFILTINGYYSHDYINSALKIVFIASLLFTLIKCHRLFILQSTKLSHSNIFKWNSSEVKFTAWWVLLIIGTMLIAYSFMFIYTKFRYFILSTEYLPHFLASNFPFIVYLIVIISSYYLIARLSLVLPAAATDMDNKGLIWSWKSTRGNGWRLFLLLTIFPFTMNLIMVIVTLKFPTYNSLIFSLSSGLFWLVTGVIEIGVLSLSYYHFVGADEIEHTINMEKLNASEF